MSDDDEQEHQRDREATTPNSKDQQTLSPEDLIATVAEQQEKAEEQEKEPKDDIDPVALERGQRFVPRGAFAAGRQDHESGRTLLTNDTPTGAVPLEAILVHPEQDHGAIDDDEDIFTAHPIESVANKQAEPRWTAQVWCRYCLAGLCLVTVLALCIVGILVLQRDSKPDKGRGGYEENGLNNFESWFTHHGVALGSRTDCSPSTPVVTFTLQCPNDAKLLVHHTSNSILYTRGNDNSTILVDVPIDWAGYVALDCVSQQTKPPLQVADLVVTMEAVVVLQCPGGDVQTFAQFVRRCGSDKQITRALVDCGNADDVSDGMCVNYADEDCLGDTATCLPDVTVYDRTGCPASPNPQDVSFLNAIEQRFQGNSIAAREFQRFDFLRPDHHNDDVPWEDDD